MKELLQKIQAGYVLQDEDVALIARFYNRTIETYKDIDAYSDLGIENYKTRPRVIRSLFISIKNILTD